MTAGPPPGGPPGRLRRLPRRGWIAISGTAGAASLGLALLVFTAVFISVAIPRASLGQRTHALHRVLAAVPPASTAVLGNVSYASFDVDFAERPFAAGQLAVTRAELSADLARRGLPLGTAPAWAGLASGYAAVTGAPRATTALPPLMEILYRDRLSSYSRLTAGRLPQQGRVSHGRVILQVAVTGATAARFGLRPGSRLGYPPDTVLDVTGIVTPSARRSAFWGADPVAAAAELTATPPPTAIPYWLGAVFVGPAELPLLQASVPTDRIQVVWAVPLATAHLAAGQVTSLQARLGGVLATGGNVGVNGLLLQITLSSGILGVLSAFSGQDHAIGAVLGLLFVSLAVIGIVAVLLGAGLSRPAGMPSSRCCAPVARRCARWPGGGWRLRPRSRCPRPRPARYWRSRRRPAAAPPSPGGWRDARSLRRWPGCRCSRPPSSAAPARGRECAAGARGRLTPGRAAPRPPGAWWPRRDWPPQRSAGSSCSGGRACPRAASTRTRARRPCWWRSWPPSSSCTATRLCSGCCCGWPGPGRGTAPSSGSRGPPGPPAAPSCRSSPWSWPWLWSHSAP